MSDMKWPVAALEIRLQDPDPMIRAWAARWLRDYHGTAGEVALRRFVDAKKSIQAATEQASGLQRVAPEPAAKHPQPVGQEIAGPRGETDVRAFLLQALSDPRTALTPDFLAACPPVSLLPRVLASMRRGAEANGDWEGLAEQVLLSAGAGVEHLRLAEVAVGKRTPEAFLTELKERLPKPPEGLAPVLSTFLVDKKAKIEGLVPSLAPLWPTGGEDELPRRTAPLVLRVRGQLAWRIAACRAMAEDVAKWPFAEDASGSGPILVLALALAALRARATLGLVRDDISPEDAVSLVEAGYPWLDDSVFAWAAERWGEGRRADLATHTLARLEVVKDPVGRSNLLRLIGEAKDEGILGKLLDYLAKEGVEGIERAAFAALTPMAAKAREALRGRLDTAHTSLLLVAVQLVIEDPCEAAEAFLYDEWDAIARRLPLSAPLCMAAELFASPRFLGKLLPLWRPGEERIETTIAFLSKWTKEAAPPVKRIAAIHRAWAERDAHRKPPRAGDLASLEEIVHEFHRLPLGCARCGAVYRYDVGFCYLQPLQGATAKDLRLEFRGFQHVVQCKRCLARDEYGVTEEGQFVLQCRQQLAIALVEQGKKGDEVFARSLCILDSPRTADGNEISTTADAIRRQLGRVHASPRDADAWTRLGNLYHHGGLYADARDAFEAAVGVDPKRPDAVFGLAILDHEELRPAKAADRFREVVRVLADRKVPPEAGLPYFDESVRRLLEIEKDHGVPFRWEQGGDPGDLASAAVRQRVYFKMLGLEPPARHTETRRDEPQTISATREVGRNDPCPCRSGKKYKKCCGKE